MVLKEKLFFLLDSGINQNSTGLFFTGLSLILSSLLILFYPMVIIYFFCALIITAGAILIWLSFKTNTQPDDYDQPYFKYY